jgi:hypothetical protein
MVGLPWTTKENPTLLRVGLLGAIGDIFGKCAILAGPVQLGLSRSVIGILRRPGMVMTCRCISST